MDDFDIKNINLNNVVTAVRVRPISSTESSIESNVVVSISDKIGEVILVNPVYYTSNKSEKDRELNERKFAFDYSFWSVSKSDSRYSNQIDVYNTIGLPIVQNCLNGFNCSLFAYGTVNFYKI